jgi:hypothetical protein
MSGLDTWHRLIAVLVEAPYMKKKRKRRRRSAVAAVARLNLKH